MSERQPSAFLSLARDALCGVVRFLVGAYPSGSSSEHDAQTIFFANHTSHLDALTILAALGPAARAKARPVAARDYWCKDRLRRWLAEQVLEVVFIDRLRSGDADPLSPVREALDGGASLIFFPEGTRSESQLPGAFKGGLYALALQYQAVCLRPIYLENLHRILPKGSLLPVPLINKVRFGEPLPRIVGEARADFLVRARQAVCDLASQH